MSKRFVNPKNGYFICCICKKEQPKRNFAKRNGTECGRKSTCKHCASIYNHNYYWSHPEYRERELRNGHSPERRSQQHWAHVKSKFGITEKDYLWILEQQSGCALCGKVCDYRLHTDHDHAHHKNPQKGCFECIRGLLCRICNYRHLPWLERNPHLQNDFVKNYLAGRPLVARQKQEKEKQLEIEK